MTTDINGNIGKRLVSAIAGGGSGCTSTNFITKFNGTSSVCSQIYDNGINVGIGITSPGNKLTVNGNIQSLTNTFLSDKNFKREIKTIDNALDAVLKLNGTTYFWNKTVKSDYDFPKNIQYGLIAQEVEKILPDLVLKTSEGEYSLNYVGLIPVLIEAIKEQQNQIIILNNKISELEFEDIDSDNFSQKNQNYFSSNYPNPFEIETNIDVYVNKNIKDARIIVYDNNGNTISSQEVKERDVKTKIIVSKKSFTSGIYFYTLITDGVVVGTKKMIVK